MSDLISRRESIDAICRVCLVCRTETCQGRNPDSRWCEEITALREIPSTEPWDIIKTMLKELEQKEERLYLDYCDATARLRAIDKIAKSSQKPNLKIDGIKPLAELETRE